MPGRTYIKTFIREIFGSFGRLAAIFGIVTLGVGFLSGLLATTPNMKTSMDSYFKRTNMMDIFIKSTVGFTNEDIQAVKDMPEVDVVMPAYVTDAMIRTVDDDPFVARIYGLPLEKNNEPDFINRMDLVEGRFPERDDECVVHVGGGYLSAAEIGTTLTIIENPDFENLDDVFSNIQYKVTGIVNSPLFISYDREPSNAGGGSLGMVIYVRESCFSLPVYTDLFILLENRSSFAGFTQPYEEFVSEALYKIEDMGYLRSVVRYEEVIAEAERQFGDAEAEYEEGRIHAEMEFALVRQELDTGAAEIAKGEAELANAENQLAEGRRAFEAERLRVETELRDNERLLRNGMEEIAAARRMLAEAKMLLDDAEKKVESSRGKWYTFVLPWARRGIREYDAGLASYNEGLKTVEEHEKELEQGWEALEAGRQQAIEGFALAEAEFKRHEEEIRKGYAELAEAKARLTEGEAAYTANLLDVSRRLLEGGMELQKARQNLHGNIPLPRWYVMDRSFNVGAVFYRNNVEKIADVAKVFPIFFLLVAALVALTTMTRMVEEECIQIGTLKALGYKKGTIIAKYLAYCALAGVLGSIAGMIAGFRILPVIIYNAFSTMYHMPPLITNFYFSFGLIACGSILACTMGATIYACYHSLWEKPAYLMIPKPPKSGKRIFLEHIPVIWNRMKFTHKVTARNLMRRKRHFLMTVTGIAGCTALMTAGFGLRDSVNDIASTQFEKILNYDLQIKLEDENLSFPYLNELNDRISVHSESGYIIKDNKRSRINIVVPRYSIILYDFIRIRDRRTHTPLILSDSGVILTEMAALQYNLKIGDRFTLENSKGIENSFILTGITENYVGVSVYMGREAYSGQFGEQPSYTTILAKTDIHTQAAQDSLFVRLLADDNVMAVEFKSQIQRSYNNFLGSMIFIVLMIVVASGALAMIVLYTLTSININERTREIATLRVLGYHKSEAAVIIFREIAILSIIGTILGLFLGIPLHRFIIGIAETIEMMFGRRITPMSFLLSGIITMVFSTGVDIFMYKRIGSINMAESMKRE